MNIASVYRIDCGCGCAKFYIGSTTQNLASRMTGHRSCARKGVNSKIYNHMREVGSNCFLISQIAEVKFENKNELRAMENKYIIELDAIRKGFNGRLEAPRCQHDRRRQACHECDGSYFCEHKKQKQHCKECNGSSICIHSKQIHHCRICQREANKFCPHDTFMNRCKYCSARPCIACNQTYSEAGFKLHVKTRKHLINSQEH